MGMISWLRRKLILSEAHADLDFMVEKKAAQEAVAKSNTIIASEAKKQKELGVSDDDIIRALRMDWKDPTESSVSAPVKESPTVYISTLDDAGYAELLAALKQAGKIS